MRRRVKLLGKEPMEQEKLKIKTIRQSSLSGRGDLEPQVNESVMEKQARLILKWQKEVICTKSSWGDALRCSSCS